MISKNHFRRGAAIVPALIALAVFPVHQVQAKRAMSEATADVPRASTVAQLAQMRVDHVSAMQAAYVPNFVAKAAAPELQAREFLRAARAELGLPNADADLAKQSERNVGTLRVVRFAQMYRGHPVRDSQIDVTVNRDGKIIFVASGYRRIDGSGSKRAVVAADVARATAHHAIGTKMAVPFEETKLVWWVEDGRATLVHDVHIDAADVVGFWSVLIDAQSGEVLHRQDMAVYGQVNGTATVFNPDPLSTALATYDVGGYTDSNDADVAVLNAERETVTLRDIDLTAGMHTLNGPWAACSDHESPTGGANACPSQASADFSVMRASQVFEAANVYFHIDTAMRYYNVTLGIAVRPSVYATGVRFDPHGLNNADNSHYEGGGLQRLAFGDGGIDDAEDADVIVHELGHGLHDWITSGGLSQVEGLSEGVGDYFASSYARALNTWTPAQAPYFWMFHWDGHNPTWPGRITDYHTDVDYPNLGSPSPHIPGQYWASCNLLAHDLIGRDKMDKAMLLGLGLTNSSSSQSVAAQAILNAMDADNFFTRTDIETVFDVYTRGRVNGGCNYPVTLPLDPAAIFDDSFE